MQKNLFSEKCIEELKNRIETLKNNSTPKWGQMNVSQMFAHCCEVLKNALGESTFIIGDKRKFDHEKQKLMNLIAQFHAIERRKLQNSVHPILGKFTPEQWAIGQYKHLDHHLRQFGV